MKKKIRKIKKTTTTEFRFLLGAGSHSLHQNTCLFCCYEFKLEGKIGKKKKGMKMLSDDLLSVLVVVASSFVIRCEEQRKGPPQEIRVYLG